MLHQLQKTWRHMSWVLFRIRKKCRAYLLIFEPDKMIILTLILKWKKGPIAISYRNNWQWMMTASYISSKHQGWYDCRTESKFHFFALFCFSTYRFHSWCNELSSLEYISPKGYLNMNANAFAIITYSTSSDLVDSSVNDLFSSNNGNHIKSAIIFGIVFNSCLWIEFASAVIVYLSNSIWKRARKRKWLEEKGGNKKRGNRKSLVLLPTFSFLSVSLSPSLSPAVQLRGEYNVKQGEKKE